MPIRSQVLAGTALAAALCLPGCGSEPGPAGPPERGSEFFAAALASVEKTPEPLRVELLKTCDKYRQRDRPCDEERLRRDLLECWSDKGERIFAWVEGRPMGPRAKYLRTLLEVNMCMEYKGWRKIQRGPEFTPRRG
jgi:hypothetical protein